MWVRGIGLPVVVDTGAQGYILAWELNECSWFLSPCKSLKVTAINGVSLCDLANPICTGGSCLSPRQAARTTFSATGTTGVNRFRPVALSCCHHMTGAQVQGFDSPHLHPQHNRLRRMGRVRLS